MPERINQPSLDGLALLLSVLRCKPSVNALAALEMLLDRKQGNASRKETTMRAIIKRRVGGAADTFDLCECETPQAVGEILRTLLSYTANDTEVYEIHVYRAEKLEPKKLD